MISSKAINIFSKVIEHYHIIDDINQKYDNPYKKKTIESLLHKKVWIDTIQWHLEDIIRDPNIDVKYALKITTNKVIGVIGTTATIKSDAYGKKLRLANKKITIININIKS